MIERVRLVRYKGFEQFDLRLGTESVLVGPNNAGKTTLVHALRLVTGLSRHARRRNATGGFRDAVFADYDRWVQGHRIVDVAARELSWYKDENLRHEFRDESAGIEVCFKGGSRLRAIWPVDDEAFFYVESRDGIVARTPAAVRACTPEVGVVPTLGPVEHREEVLSENYVRESIGTRLTSRHFRNQIHHLASPSSAAGASLAAFILLHTPELQAMSLRPSYGGGSHELDLFVTEAATNSEKEIYWLGDGLQVWLQVLFHVWMAQNADTVILDEPDVFLHPDLQRRLVALLEEHPGQTVVATHAPEMVSESNQDAVIWVDRTRRRSRRARDAADLDRLNASLGSGFNLGMARALRSRVALFVEGQDIRILRNIARTVGAERVRTERGLAVIPLGGFSNWHQVQPFAWLSRELLGEAISIFVVLDRDHRSDAAVTSLVDSLRERHVTAHVWSKKELESYLLVPSAIARVTTLGPAVVSQQLDRIVDSLRFDTQAKFLTQRQAEAASARQQFNTVMQTALPEFEALWANPDDRLRLAAPKDVIAEMSRFSQGNGGQALSARGISSRLRVDEVDDEMAQFLLLVEEALT